jgi:SAM-dependent methyltransferase
MALSDEMPWEFANNPAIPQIATEKVDRCVVCGGISFDTVAKGYDLDLLTCRNQWQFRQCLGCKHVQLDPRPAIDTLSVIYPSHYYSYNMEKNVGCIALAGKAALDRLKFQWLFRILGHRPRSYLDIGCGDGKYLDLLHDLGVHGSQLYGLELDHRAVETSRARGYQVFNERVEVAHSIPDSAAEMTTMFHVIEHVADPSAVIARVHRWLRPSGILALETPNLDANDSRLFRKRYWGSYHAPRHWHLFNEGSLRSLLERNGFMVEAIRYQTGRSFWLYSLHHTLRYYRTFPIATIARAFDPMKSLPMQVLATGFDLLRARLGAPTSAIMIVARRLEPPDGHLD